MHENPDFAKLAEAASVLSLKAETAVQVRPMLVEEHAREERALTEIESRHFYEVAAQWTSDANMRQLPDER